MRYLQPAPNEKALNTLLVSPRNESDRGFLRRLVHESEQLAIANVRASTLDIVSIVAKIYKLKVDY